MSTPTQLAILAEWKSWRHISGAAENTVYAQSKYVEKFIRSMKRKSIDNIKPEMVHEFVNADDGKSFNTKSFALSALRAFYTFAKGMGYCQINPAEIVKVNRRKLSHKQREGREVIPFTAEEVKQILSVRSPRFLRIATAISWYTGLRIVDICKLEWDSISDTHIIVWTDKRDKRVALPLDHIALGGGALKPFLDEIEKTDDRFCFPVEKAKIESPHSRSRTSDNFTRLIKKYGIWQKGKSFHSLRHSFVTRLADMGMSLKDIGVLVGHSNEKTTEGYSHV